MIPELDIEEALCREDLLFVDVRSPAEFKRESIPGAVNIPLFDDEERHRLGLIYHDQGEPAARRAALRMVAPRLPELADRITAEAGRRIPLLYCWRGGMRSQSLCQILFLAGVRVLRLKGGYRAFRRLVHRSLQEYRFTATAVVLHGLTGTGKTELVREIGCRGYAALDLEELAGHRGSVFGAVGLGSPRSQKDFDALLLFALRKFAAFPYLVLEGEGRRIGDVHLPPFLVKAMEKGLHILVTAPLSIRVERIMREYLPARFSGEEVKQIRQALLSLKRRLGKTPVNELLTKLDGGDYKAVVEKLCTEYYDRFYNDAKPGKREFAMTIDASCLQQSAEELASFLDRTFPPVQQHSETREECCHESL